MQSTGAGAAGRNTPVLDLERGHGCRECDARGKGVVSIKWAEA